ncbi:MAG: AAA family ATPase [Terrimicrobiaceae bacterium]
MDYLKPDNGWKIGVGPGVSLIRFFSKVYLEYLADAKSEEQLHAAAEAAGKRIGIRCLAAELLSTDFASKLSLDEKISVADEIAKAGALISVEANLKRAVAKISEALPGLEEMLRWFVAPGIALNLYSMQADYPSVQIVFPNSKAKDKKEKIPASKIIESLKSAGQRAALEKLTTLAKIRHTFGDSINSIPLRPAGFLVGPSGSGKTWIARAFAAASSWEFVELTVSGWCVQNAKSESTAWSLSVIKGKLAAGPLVVFIDELCKIRTTGSADNGNWYRGCQTEIMQLLDRSLGDVPLTDTERENLKNSWIICAGAFQEIYKRKIGGEVLFDESLDVTLTRADLEEFSGLPGELLNRFSEIIPVQPPTRDELFLAYRAISEKINFETSDKERMEAADEAIKNLQGFRGLESYAIAIARKALSQEGR